MGKGGKKKGEPGFALLFGLRTPRGILNNARRCG
jgi:hypothetical protein